MLSDYYEEEIFAFMDQPIAQELADIIDPHGKAHFKSSLKNTLFLGHPKLMTNFKLYLGHSCLECKVMRTIVLVISGTPARISSWKFTCM